MGRKTQAVGAAGETIASAFLKKKGYRVIGSNYRTPLGEIDLIARQGRTIIFAEIKTRTTASFGPPHLSVTGKKQLHIVRAAMIYLKARGLLDADWRVDVVSVKLDHCLKVESIEHIENAVEGLWSGGSK